MQLNEKIKAKTKEWKRNRNSPVAWGKTSNITVWRWVYVTHPFSLFLSLFRLLTLIPHPLLLPLFLSSSSSVGVGFQDPNLFPMKNLSFFLITTLFAAFSAVRSDPSDHRYKEGDSVPLYANKVGPFHNPRYFRSHSILIAFPSLITIIYRFPSSLQRNLPLLRPSLLWTRFVSLLFITHICHIYIYIYIYIFIFIYIYERQFCLSSRAELNWFECEITGWADSNSNNLN